MSISSNISPDCKNSIYRNIGIKFFSYHSKYLGRNVVFGRSKKEVFSFMVDRFWKKTQSVEIKGVVRASIKIFKAKYFPNCNFKDASLGFSPNYMWRNILNARGVLKTDCRRKIGNSRKVQIWKDYWVPTILVLGAKELLVSLTLKPSFLILLIMA